MDGSIINSGCNNTRYLEKDHLPPRCFSFVVFLTQICNKYAEKEYSLKQFPFFLSVVYVVNVISMTHNQNTLKLPI